MESLSHPACKPAHGQWATWGDCGRRSAQGVAVPLVVMDESLVSRSRRRRSTPDLRNGRKCCI